MWGGRDWIRIGVPCVHGGGDVAPGPGTHTGDTVSLLWRIKKSRSGMVVSVGCVPYVIICGYECVGMSACKRVCVCVYVDAHSLPLPKPEALGSQRQTYQGCWGNNWAGQGIFTHTHTHTFESRYI